MLILAIVLASRLLPCPVSFASGLDLRGGASMILRVKVDEYSAAQQHEVVEQTRQILEPSHQRIRSFRNARATVWKPRQRTARAIPGVSDPSRIRNLLQSRAVLEWYSVDGGPYPERHSRTWGVQPYIGNSSRQTDDGWQRAWYVAGACPGTNCGARVPGIASLSPFAAGDTSAKRTSARPPSCSTGDLSDPVQE